MTTKSERLTVLSDAEQEALYGLPDFDDAQRLEYLALTETELALASSRPGLHAQVYCILQIGYFKAKHAFFRFDWSEVEHDCAFVLSRYFHGESFEHKPISKHEHYTQREWIADLFGYRPWAAEFLAQLAQQAAQTVRRDVMPGFIAAELIVWLNEHKIIRPGYTTLQELVSEALSAERRRLAGLLSEVLDESAKAALRRPLVRAVTLSQLAALKQDAKDFGWRQMAREREKRATLEPLHRIAKALLPKLGVSQQNLLYYASLANFYTVHDLRNLKADQTYLYLLCYAWVRYRQLSDNLVDAMAYHMKQLEDESSAGAKQSFVAEQVRRQQDTPQVGRLLSLYIDDSVPDPTPFGDVRQRAYKIMPRDTLQTTAQRMSVKPVSKLALHWQAVDGLAERIRRHLRHDGRLRPLCLPTGRLARHVAPQPEARRLRAGCAASRCIAESARPHLRGRLVRAQSAVRHRRVAADRRQRPGGGLGGPCRRLFRGPAVVFDVRSAAANGSRRSRVAARRFHVALTSNAVVNRAPHGRRARHCSRQQP